MYFSHPWHKLDKSDRSSSAGDGDNLRTPCSDLNCRDLSTAGHLGGKSIGEGSKRQEKGGGEDIVENTSFGDTWSSAFQRVAIGLGRSM